MYDRHFITVRNRIDRAIPDVCLDFATYEEASRYWHDNHATAESEGCTLLLCSERIASPVPKNAVFRVCTTCSGSGAVTTRMADLGGAFSPDEDACGRCGGTGRIVVVAHDITPARAA